jgi:endo-1,4-beta-D-glucanase Y
VAHIFRRYNKMANVKRVKRQPIYIELDKKRQLKFTLNAMAELEDKYGTIDDAMKKLDSGSMKAIRFMLWAGLMHEDDALTETQVGDMLEMQDLQEIAEKLNKTMGIDLPDDGQREELNKTNPNE